MSEAKLGRTYRKTDENFEKRRQEKEQRNKRSENKKKFLYEKPTEKDRDDRNKKDY